MAARLLVPLLALCFGFPPASADDGPTPELKKHGNFYVGPALTTGMLKDFKAKGGATVIDLRGFEEKGECGEAAVAAKMGIRYYAAPMPKSDPVTNEAVDAVNRVLADAEKGKPVLLTCSTGSRAAAFLAVRLAREEKMPVEQAIAAARALGLKPATEELVRMYLKP